MKGSVDESLRALVEVSVGVASDGEFPLLGTMLLANRQLAIDYRERTVALD